MQHLESIHEQNDGVGNVKIEALNLGLERFVDGDCNALSDGRRRENYKRYENIRRMEFGRQRAGNIDEDW